MNAIFRRFVRDAVAPIGEMEARLFKQATRFFFIASCLFVAAIFLTIAFYLFIQTLAGPAIAALSIGGLYLGVALVGIAVAALGSGESNKGPAHAASVGQTGDAAENASAPRPELAANIDSAVSPILDILRDAGLQRERLAVEAGASIVKQLNPLTLVAFSIVAGFILGRALGNARPADDGAPTPSNESAV